MITHAEDVLKDHSLTGSAFCDALTKRTDAFLKAIYEDAMAPQSTALVAIGGYGRRELCPGRDIDVLLVHNSELEVSGKNLVSLMGCRFKTRSSGRDYRPNSRSCLRELRHGHQFACCSFSCWKW